MGPEGLTTPPLLWVRRCRQPPQSLPAYRALWYSEGGSLAVRFRGHGERPPTESPRSDLLKVRVSASGSGVCSLSRARRGPPRRNVSSGSWGLECEPDCCGRPAHIPSPPPGGSTGHASHHQDCDKSCLREASASSTSSVVTLLRGSEVTMGLLPPN